MKTVERRTRRILAGHDLRALTSRACDTWCCMSLAKTKLLNVLQCELCGVVRDSAFMLDYQGRVMCAAKRGCVEVSL